MKAIAVLLFGCFAATAFAQQKVELCDLIRNPAKFSGKQVTVRATLATGFEWSWLYCLQCKDQGSVWLEFAPELDDKSEKSVKRAVNASVVNLTVDGVFIGPGAYGHMNGSRFKFIAASVRDVVVLQKKMKSRKKEKEIEQRYACGGTNPK